MNSIMNAGLTGRAVQRMSCDEAETETCTVMHTYMSIKEMLDGKAGQ